MNKNLLFNPITLPNGNMVKNRFFKSAMSESMAKNDHLPTENHFTLYNLWKQGGASIIVSGNVMVDRKHLGEPGNVVLDKHSDLTAFKQWTQTFHPTDAHLWMQINHPGKQSPKSLTKVPLAPSSVRLKGGMKRFFNPPKALSTEEINIVIDQYIYTAQKAYEVGFDGVQIHAAHGYLVSQFLSPIDNIRTDQYGGNIENRMRFLKEIFIGIKKKVGKNFSISVKLNSNDFIQGGFSEEDSLYVIQTLNDLGIDLIEISGGNYENPVMSKASADSKEEGFFIEFSKRALNISNAPIVLTGGFRSEDAMIRAIEKNYTSMIGLGRPLVITPDLPKKIHNRTYNNPEVKRLTTGFKTLDQKFGAMMGIVYYEQQMKRLVKGKPVKLHKNGYKPLLHMLFTHGPTSFIRKRTR